MGLKDGRVLARQVTSPHAGAYTTLSAYVVDEHLVCGPYHIPNCYVEGYSVYGQGRRSCRRGLELLRPPSQRKCRWNKIAAKLGMIMGDPLHQCLP